MSKYLALSSDKKSRARINSFASGVNFFSDEATSSIAMAKDCYNFDFSSGALTEGYGIESSGLFDGYEVAVAWLYKRYDFQNEKRDDRVLIATKSGEVYQLYGNGSVSKIYEGFTKTPQFINYRLNGEDVVFMCSTVDGMFVYDGVSVPYKVEGAPNITTMVLHGERLFVTVDGDKSAIYFSDDLDPTNWDESLTGGGFIQMIDERGSLNKVVSYLNYLYVFRDYGITRINAIGNQSDFSVSNLFVSGGRIFPQTVTLCGDMIVFLAEDGLYGFDGVSANRLLKNLDGLINANENARALYASGKYYLAFNRDLDDDTVGVEEGEYLNNAMLVLDVSTGRYCLSRGMDISAFCFLEDAGVSAITADGKIGMVKKCGTLFGLALKKKWTVPLTDMGTPKKKRVKEVFLRTLYPCTVLLTNDEKSKSLEFTADARVQRKRTSFSGRRVGLQIISFEKSAHITRPSVTISENGF